MKTTPIQLANLEKCKKIDNEDTDNNGSHMDKRGVNGLVGGLKDQFGNLKVWMAKDEVRNTCQCNRCKAENPFFRPK